MLDLLFLRVADVALRAADADVGERCQCQCQWGGTDADGATVESTVEDGSKRYRSVGGDDLVQDKRVWNKRRRACLLNWEVKSMGGIEMRFFTEYVQYLYWKALSIY
jgi:hypothetical protein